MSKLFKFSRGDTAANFCLCNGVPCAKGKNNGKNELKTVSVEFKYLIPTVFPDVL
jgi:hypothetical protein